MMLEFSTKIFLKIKIINKIFVDNYNFVISRKDYNFAVIIILDQLLLQKSNFFLNFNITLY